MILGLKQRLYILKVIGTDEIKGNHVDAGVFLFPFESVWDYPPHGFIYLEGVVLSFWGSKR